MNETGLAHKIADSPESYVTKTRDRTAALIFIKKALICQCAPAQIATYGLRSYRAALTALGNTEKQEVGRLASKRVETSQLPFLSRERAMLRFRRLKSLRKLASVHTNVHINFDLERYLVDR